MESLAEILGFSGVVIVGLLLIILGFVGSLLPVLPGPPLAVLSVWLLHFTYHTFAWYVLLSITLIGLIIILVDYILPIWGTKKYGGTKAGVRGSTIGMIFGVIASFTFPAVGIIGLFVGPFLGAFIGEKMVKSNNEVALKSAVGSLFGFLVGAFGKILVTALITFVFLYGIFYYIIN